MAKDKTTRAITYAWRLFNIRPRSEKELKERLLQKGFDRASISGAVSFFKEKDIIDDLMFARLWVESRMHAAPKGDMLLRRELREKGISDSIADKVLSEKEEKEEPVARGLAEKKLRTLKGMPEEKVKKKLFEYLARRGFKFDLIEEIVRDYAKR